MIFPSVYNVAVFEELSMMLDHSWRIAGGLFANNWLAATVLIGVNIVNIIWLVNLKIKSNRKEMAS